VFYTVRNSITLRASLLSPLEVLAFSTKALTAKPGSNVSLLINKVGREWFLKNLKK